jgi:1-acyl-sn-glycerol-3-phosphate acyltransferase
MIRAVERTASPIVVLRSLGIWSLVGLSVASFFPPVAVAYALGSPFDRRRLGSLYFMRLWARTLMRLNPMWDVQISGLENVDPKATYVIAANHQSHGDILVLGFLDHPYVYMAKAELFRIPIMGWGMAMAGCIPIRRGEKDSAREAMAGAAQKLREGVSLLIFPEGTRSRDGNMGPFKDGAFRLAIQTGRPVLPVAIHGSRTALPKGSWLFTERSRVRVEVLPAVPVEGLTEDQAPELKSRVRELIESKVAQLFAAA